MAESPPRRLRPGLCVLLVLTLAAPAQAITFTFGDIEITPAPPPRGNSLHGYFEYVFHVHNKSAEQPHTVTLSIPFERLFAHEDMIGDLRRTVPVGAGATVRVPLLQPDHPPIYGRDVAVIVDGRRSDSELPMPLGRAESYRSSHRPFRYSSLKSMGLGVPLILKGRRVKDLPTSLSSRPPFVGEMEFPGGMGGPGMPGAAMPGAPPMPGAPGMAPGVAPGGFPGGAMPPPLPMPALPWEAFVLPPTQGLLQGAMNLVVWNALAEGVQFRPPAHETKPGLPPHSFDAVIAESWSDNWLAYSRYDGILITADELRSLPAAVQSALWQYVETGGALLVLGKTELRGLSAISERSQDAAGWLTVRAGFGVCRVSPDANYDTWDAAHFTALARDWSGTVGVWTNDRNTSDANREFPVIDDIGIPVKGLFVLMFLFTLGIGPINFLVLSRMKRRIWLLWTTPAISLCTCLAVFGYMLISEGWQGQVRIETLTLLDETTHRATTIGWAGVYSPLTPGDGLHFSYETEVVPQRYFEYRGGGARSCTIDWTRDQHFASGWVEARVPAHFKVRKSKLHRERVDLQRGTDGRWSMVNGLAAAIRRFWYADERGQIHVAENIAAGARATLTPSEREVQVSATTPQSILAGKWMVGMEQLAARPQHFLRPNRYLAEVEGSPFLDEDVLRNARTRRVRAFVMGFGSPTGNEEDGKRCTYTSIT